MVQVVVVGSTLIRPRESVPSGTATQTGVAAYVTPYVNTYDPPTNGALVPTGTGRAGGGKAVVVACAAAKGARRIRRASSFFI
jgi:hypothetical protein